ncbi:uncharacterized protein [Haliotis asinina]|uniref:uncharacterized protein n=1 Tax=Haliotis asinina TaxID=109174 RepID=UPI0035320B8E
MASTSDDSNHTDCADKCLKDYIMRIFVNLETAEHVVEKLKLIGVESVQDLSLVQEKDLTEGQNHLKTIVARKLLKHACQLKLPLLTSAETESDLSDCSTPSTSSTFSPPPPPPIVFEGRNRDPNWPLKLDLNWSSMTRDVMKPLESKQRLVPTLKRKLVRHLMDMVRSVTVQATKRQLSIIAQRAVAKYPDSLEDRIDDDVVGSGYESLLNRLISRNDNLNRGISVDKLCLTKHNLKRRQADTDSSDADRSRNSGISAPRSDSYGCINWEPHVEEEDELKIKHVQAELLKLNEGDPKEVDAEVIAKGMETVYPLLRSVINNGASMANIKAEWPFLFHTVGMLNHFEKLVGINMKDALANSYRIKAPRMNRFFRNKLPHKSSHIFEEAIRQSQNDNVKAWLVAVLLCIMEYMGEKQESLFLVADVTSTPEFIEAMDTPENPMMIVHGDSVLAGQHYTVMCDHLVISPRLNSFIDAFAMLFAAFYVFNIEYQTGSAATLEFIQRCFVRINPDKGSKGCKGKRKKTVMSAKVLKLINELADFEWIEA